MEDVKSWKFQARTVNDKAAGYGCADCLKTAGMPALTEKTCDDRFLQPGREVAQGKFALQTLLLSVDIIKKFGELIEVGDLE